MRAYGKTVFFVLSLFLSCEVLAGGDDTSTRKIIIHYPNDATTYLYGDIAVTDCINYVRAERPFVKNESTGGKPSVTQVINELDSPLSKCGSTIKHAVREMMSFYTNTDHLGFVCRVTYRRYLKPRNQRWYVNVGIEGESIFWTEKCRVIFSDVKCGGVDCRAEYISNGEVLDNGGDIEITIVPNKVKALLP